VFFKDKTTTKHTSDRYQRTEDKEGLPFSSIFG